MTLRTYDDFSDLTRSSKIVLCHIEPKQRHAVFTLHSGAVYKKSMSYFVVNVEQDGISLVKNTSASLSAGEWWYDADNSMLYVRMDDDSDPKLNKVVTTYRLFYSNRPIDLPYDLSTGSEVHYDGRLESSSPITKQLDDEQIGVVLETSTNITLINTDGHFDDFYDVLIFENKSIKLYSWNELIPLSEHKKLFDGLIQDKSYTTKNIRFNCKDFTLKLREPVACDKFSTSDGDIPDRYLNTPKRRLFGRFQKLRCVPIDSIKEGFTVTGALSGTYASTTITGSGTSFLSELSPEDELTYDNGVQTYKFQIASVDSDTQLTMTETLSISLNAFTMTCKPKRPYRGKNRNWHIAGHKLRAPSTTISTAIDERRFIPVSTEGLLANDLIKVNGEDAYIQRITGTNQVTLTTNLQGGIPSVGDTVTKNPVDKAYINGSQIFIDRDWDVTNGTNDAILNIDPLAEFNVAPIINVSTNLTFTNGSRSVTVSGLDFRTEVQTRDWVRSTDITHTTWYEILEVQENTIILRTAYAGSNFTDVAQKKNVNLVDDNAIVTVNCMGQERSGNWIETASDAIKDMLENDIGFTNINTSSFTEADADAPFTLSYAIPANIGGSVKSIRDVINDINKSVFGSLVIDENFDLKYQVLTCERPTDITEIKDDDLSSRDIAVQSRNEIIRTVNARYAHFIDGFNGEDAFDLYSFTNEFVDDLVGLKSEMDIDIYLYKLDDATTIAQRYAFYNSLSQSKVILKGKLNLYSYILNSKIYLNLDRLYKRFGNLSRLKIGLVNKISNDGKNVSIEINDLGNTFNRAACISDNATNDFTSASDDEKIRYSWICDDDILTPSSASDTEIYTNLIN